MNLQVVSYDLDRPGQNYPEIVTRLTALGARRILFSQWMLRTNMTAQQLRDDLLKHIDANDRLLVVNVTNAPMAWNNLQVEIKTAFNLA